MGRFIIAMLSCLFTATSSAHKLAPSLLQIDQQESGLYHVIWKTPLKQTGGKVEPDLPRACKTVGVIVPSVEGTAKVTRWKMNCDRPLAGLRIGVQGLGKSGTAALLKVNWYSGNQVQQLLNGENSSWDIPLEQTTLSVFVQYVTMGMEHILLGFDHLLYVLALLMLISGGWKLLKTITAFTCGHSVTLVLVSLGYFNYSVTLVEFFIAFSILMLAIDLSRMRSSKQSYITKQAPFVAISFGLLHGMGFAGALAEIGLPNAEIPIALFSFNLGIEIGQLAFVLLCILLVKVLAEKLGDWTQRIRSGLVYTIGGLSAFWCIERGFEVIQYV